MSTSKYIHKGGMSPPHDGATAVASCSFSLSERDASNCLGAAAPQRHERGGTDCGALARTRLCPYPLGVFPPPRTRDARLHAGGEGGRGGRSALGRGDGHSFL